jgi:uncharacterized repeat protein (TIGR03803 family)
MRLRFTAASRLRTRFVGCFFIAAALVAFPAAAATYSSIYGFAGGGANPGAAPVLGKDGALYGVTANGGANYSGAVYRLVPPVSTGASGAGSVVYSFAGGDDGATPDGSLLQDAWGNLYGVTYYGGSANYGTVFELSPPTAAGGSWTKTTLYQFTNGTDGANPRAGLLWHHDRGVCHAGLVRHRLQPCQAGQGALGLAIDDHLRVRRRRRRQRSLCGAPVR